MQVLQELLCLIAVGGKVTRNDVHVISGADGFFLFLDLASIEVGDLALHRLDSLHLIHRLDVQTHDQAGFHVEKIRQHPVVEFRGQNLYETDRAMLLTHLELLSGTEGKGAGSDEVFGREAGRSQPFPLKAERDLLIHVEDRVELGQPGLAVQRLG